MSISSIDQRSAQTRRLETKTQDQRLMNLAVSGAGISPWEAEVLTEVVQEVYFADPAHRPLRSGQMRYECVSATEGAGKAVRECQRVSVLLTLLAKEDVELGAREGQSVLRRSRIQRLSEEARDQGGLLSQEDLAQLLFCDVRSIRRDIQCLRENSGLPIPTGGQQRDIGAGLSHKGVAMRLWLEGKEPVEVARHINHSLKAVERYIQHFARVVFLRRKQFADLQIAFTVGISSAGVNTYLEIYDCYRNKKGFEVRWEEIDMIGSIHYETEDLEKGGASHEEPMSKKRGKR